MSISTCVASVIWLSTAAVVLCGPSRATEPLRTERPCAALETGPARTVTRIIDGETVELDDSTELRLIGALAPRAIDVSADPGTWAPEGKAREHLKGLLLGKSIELAFGGEVTDRYGRLQAQAFLIEAEKRRWVGAPGGAGPRPRLRVGRQSGLRR